MRFSLKNLGAKKTRSVIIALSFVILSSPLAAFAATVITPTPTTDTPLTTTTAAPDATTPAASTPSPSSSNLFSTGNLISGGGTIAGIVVPGLAPLAQATGAVVNAAAPNATPGQVAGSLAAGVASAIVSTIAYFIFQISAAILGFVGLIFNWVVTVTVFQFATYFANSAGFLTAWGILRDVGNILLLFGFIFMGIATILDIQSFSARKTLPGLLIFAVLLNFSLFASEAVVDVANALTSSFYTQAGNNESSCGSSTGTAAASISTCASTSIGISGQILEATGLQSMYNPTNTAKFASWTTTDGALILVLLAIFATIAAVVLASGAIMLFVRAVILVFLLIASPVGFAAFALPPLQGLAKSWWSKLISEAFFAPVFLLLIFVSLKIMSSFENTSSGPAVSFVNAVSTPSSGNVGVFFAFALVMAFMVASLMTARKMGASGANFAINTSTKFMGAATLGTVGFVGRRTVGRASGAIGRGIRGSAFGETGLGRAFAGVADRGATASFDARTNKTVKGLAKSGKVDIGTPSKEAAHGYHGIEEAAVKSRTDYAKTLTASRKETDAEQRERIDKTKEFAELQETQVSTVTQAKTDALQAQNEAALASQKADAELQKQQSTLSFLKTQAAQNRTDSGIAARVTAQQQVVNESQKEKNDADRLMKQRESELSKADRDLTKATTALTTARENEASARTTKIEYDGKARQGIYADKIANEWTLGRTFGDGNTKYAVSLSGHANHEAAEKIKKNRNKSEADQALDSLRDIMNKKAQPEKEESHDEEEHAPAPKPSGGAPKGGGDHGPDH